MEKLYNPLDPAPVDVRDSEWYKRADAMYNAHMADFVSPGQPGSYNQFVLESRKHQSNLDPLQTMGYLHAQEAIDTKWEYFREFGKSAYNGAIGVARGTLNSIRAARDYNIALLNEQAQAQGFERNPDQRFVEALDNAVKAGVMQPYEVKQSASAIGQLGLDIAEGAGQLAGQIAVSIPAEAVAPGIGGLGMMVAQITGGGYERLKSQGVDTKRAATAAFYNALIQAPFERLALTKLMRKIPANTVFKKKVQMVMENFLTEGVTEAIQQFPEEWSDMWALNPDKSWKELQQMAAKKFPDTFQSALYAGLIGGILGAAAGGIHIALDRNINMALRKELHDERVGAITNRIDHIKQSGISPDYAAETINANLNNATVLIDGDTLQAYAQKAGEKEVAEKLGVSMDDINEAADRGDTVEVKQGNFEALAASRPDFMESVQDSLSFDSEDMSNRKYESIQRNIERYSKLDEQKRTELKTEIDKIAATMEQAGAPKGQIAGMKAMLTSFATAMRPDNPAQFLRDNALRFERGVTRQTQPGLNYSNRTDDLNLVKDVLTANYENPRAEVENRLKQVEEQIRQISNGERTAENEQEMPKLARQRDVLRSLLNDVESGKGVAGIPSIEDYKNIYDRAGGALNIPQSQQPAQLFQVSPEEFNRQKESVRQQYENTDQWMKAPNGKDTNLTEDQWITVRTEAFKNWFGDWENDPANASKVVDENGEPKVVYHGTPSGGFEVFDPTLSYADGSKVANFFGDNKDVIEGIYYVDNVYLSGEKQLYECFLNARNPLIINADGAVWNDLEMPDGMPSQRFRNYKTGDYVYTRKTTTDRITSWAKDSGYDGVLFNDIVDGDANRNIRSNVVAVFESNQIKDATGRNVGFDPETGNIYRQEAQPERDLVAYHNISENSILRSAELGGLPVPSIAVTRKDIPFDQFGEITLIGGSDIVDPANNYLNEVFSRDAWTVTFPKTVYDKVKSKDVSALLNTFKSSFSALGDEGRREASELDYILNEGESIDNAKYKLSNQLAVMYHYVTQVLGKPVKVPFEKVKGRYDYLLKHKEISEMVKEMRYDYFQNDEMKARFSKAVRPYVEAEMKKEHGEDAEKYVKVFFTEEGYFNRNLFDHLVYDLRDYGKTKLNERKLKAELKKKIKEADYEKFIDEQIGTLYKNPQIMVGKKRMPITLDNIVAAMSALRGAGKQESLTYGDNKALAAMSKKFKSLDELRKKKANLTTQEKANLAVRVYKEKADEYREVVGSHYKWNDSWDKWDDANKALVMAAKNGGSESAIRTALLRNDFENIDDVVIDAAKEVINAAKDMQTDYFEAKPLRAVGFNEFSAAVVPNGTSKETIDYLKSQGIAVTKYNPKVEGDRQAKTERAAQKANVYFQGQQEATQTKGSFDPFTDGEAVIKLFEAADASTVIHETGHYYIESLWREIAAGRATEQQKADFERLMKYCDLTTAQWAGMDVNGRRAAHERLAEAIETYVMEDKAPSRELRPVFKRFAKWLKSIYASISRNRNAVPLTDEVREVFDRMLSSEQDVEEMRRVEGYFEKLPSVVTDNLSDATKKRIEDFILKAQDKAVDILTKQRLANFSEDRKREIENYRNMIADEVRQAIANQPLYVAARTLQETIGAASPKVYAKSFADGTMDEVNEIKFEMTAEANGFQPNELAAKLLDEPTETEAFNAAMDEAVRKEFPDYYTEREQAEEAAREAMYNDESGILLGVEQVLIEDFAMKAKAQQRSAETSRKLAMAKRQQATVAAKKELSRMRVGDAIRVDRYIAAERRCAVKSAEAAAKGDYETAKKYKDMQAYNHACVIESANLRRRVEQYQKFMKRQYRSKRESWTSETHFNQAMALFARMGKVRRDYDPTTRTQSLVKYLEEMGESLYAFDELPEWLADDNWPIPSPKELNFDEYEKVIDLMRYIRTMAKVEKADNTFETQKTYQEWRDSAVVNLNKLATKFAPVLGERQTATLKEKFDSAYQSLDNFLEKMDGWHFGFFSRCFGDVIKHANDNEFTHLEAYQKRKKEIEDAWCPTREALEAAAKEVYYEELGTSASKFVLTRILMNLGNEGNARKLCSSLPSEALRNSSLWVFSDGMLTGDEAIAQTKENLLEFLGRVLTKEDIAYAQAKVDLAGMYWGEIADLERRTRGFTPKKVEAYPVTMTLANGEQVVFRGGYFPLIRNGELGSHPAGILPVSETDARHGKNIRTMYTDRGHTMARVEAEYPVDLSEGSEDRAMRDAIHDLCWRETMTEFRRILNDPQMYALMKSKLGIADMAAFREMLEKAAQPNGGNSMVLAEVQFAQTAGWLKRKTVNSIVMLNLRINLQNFGNFFLYGNTVDGFGYTDVLGAMANAMSRGFDGRSFSEMWKFVDEKSAFMRSRSENPDITLADLREEGKLNEWERKAVDWGAKAMMYTDGMTARPVWMQAYFKKINAGATEQEAIDFADTIIRRTLGSGRATDVSSLQRGGPVFKMFTAFQGFFNTQFNQWAREYNIDRRLLREGNTGEAVQRITAFVASKYLAACLFNVVLSLENPFDDDDDDGYSNYAKELLHYPMGLIGIFGSAANFAMDKALGMKAYSYRMSIIESSLDKVYRASGKLGKLIDGEFADGLEGLTDVAGIAAGVPAQVNRLFWNAYDIVVNGMDPQLSDLATRRPKRERNK